MLKSPMFLRRTMSIVAVTAVLLALPACASNSGPATPQAKVAHSIAPITDALTALQEGITSAAQANPKFVETARKLTDVNRKISDRIGQLITALRTFDAAASLDAKKLAEVDVTGHIAAINTLIGEAFDVQLSEPSVNAVGRLISTVAKFVAALSAEFAKQTVAVQLGTGAGIARWGYTLSPAYAH